MTESSISEIFLKDPELWSEDDRSAVIARFKEYCVLMKIDPKAVDPKTGEPKKRRRSKAADPRQPDLEGLIAKETTS
jgi:hypothetical protein